MAQTERTPGEMERRLEEFANAHGLLLADAGCVKMHTVKFAALGHCPCVESRVCCPCDEALADTKKMGRCECGILIDPFRFYAGVVEHNRALDAFCEEVAAMVSIERLKEVGVFQDISDEELEMIREGVVRVQEYPPGAVLFTENSESTLMFIVDSGRVNLEIEAVPDTHLQVSSLQRNEVFGWEVLVPPYRYTTTAKAMSDSHLVVLDGAVMRKLCETHPGICAKVMERVVRIAADQLAATRQQMYMLLHSK